MNQRKNKKIIIDPGHGGLDGNGKYHTNGKMFEFPSGEMSYEGVFNRDIAKHLGDELKRLGFDIVYTVDPSDYRDITLG